jgi:hypothetical protein
MHSSPSISCTHELRRTEAGQPVMVRALLLLPVLLLWTLTSWHASGAQSDFAVLYAVRYKKYPEADTSLARDLQQTDLTATQCQERTRATSKYHKFLLKFFMLVSWRLLTIYQTWCLVFKTRCLIFKIVWFTFVMRPQRSKAI